MHTLTSKFYTARFALVLALLAGMLGALQVEPVQAATQTVTNLNDSGAGSLRQAILNAAPGDLITFQSSLAGQTITLSSPLVINKNLTINGSALSSKISMSGNNSVTVFQVQAGITAVLNSVIIKNGYSDDMGGGIYNSGGLTLTNSHLFDNSAVNYGGAAFNNNTGTLNITNSSVSANSAGEGGGIYNYGILNIANTRVFENAASEGAGVYNIKQLTVMNSTFDWNRASSNAGGIYNGSKTLDIVTSTFYRNFAEYDGGGVYNSAGTANVTNSTFAGNWASRGAGMYNHLGSLNVVNGTFAENIGGFGGGIYNSGTLNYTNTILANAVSGADCYNGSYLGVMGVIGTNVNNLVEANAASPNGCGTPHMTGDPLLGALADNGGPTQTFALLEGSPAIDAGINASCPSTDQRGVTRPQGSHCDIGAFEYAPPLPAAATLDSPSGEISDTTPVYTWDEVSDATYYYLWVERPSGSPIKQWYQASAVCSGGICSVEYPTSLGAGAHKWWIRTWNTSGYGPWSDPLNFTVVLPPPPGQATLVSPSGTTPDTRPTYTWNAVSGATWYRLWVGRPSGTPIDVWYEASDVCTGGTCSIEHPVDLGAGVHTWYVRTWNPGGYGPWSDPMSFTTTPPAATSLVSPTGNITDTTPTYTWNAVSGATWYYLWVDAPTGSGFIKQWYQASAVCSGGTCSVTAPTHGSGAHKWWVRTWSSAGYGPWSAEGSFTLP